MTAFVSIHLAQQVLKVVSEQGYDANEIAYSVGLNFNPLDAKQKLPVQISATTYNALYQKVIHLLEDECFGLHISTKVPSGTFRMLCLYIIHCEDLHSAINRAEEFCQFCLRLLNIQYYNHSLLFFADDHTVLNSLPNDHYTPAEEESITSIAASLHMWRKFCSWLIGTEIPLTSVSFKTKKPLKNSNVETLFNCDVLYEQQQNGYRFEKHWLDHKIIRNEKELDQFLKNAPLELSALHFKEAPFTNKIIGLFGNDFTQELPSVDIVADKMNMSVRTLRRRLAAENTSFQQLKDRTRLEAAKTYLKRPALKINAISALMGFEEPSAFHRAFKKWTGKTPGEFRLAALSDIQ